jgi:hypothetical protein
MQLATPDKPVVYLPSLNLLEADYNPRLLTDKQAYHLLESLLLFGVVDPLIVNQHPSRSHVIVGGHQRRRLANKVFMEGVPAGHFIDEMGNQRHYPNNHPLEGLPMQHLPGYAVPGCGVTDAGTLAVPCWPVNLELAQERELNVRLNLNGGKWDMEVLANQFDTGLLLDFGFEPFQLGIDNAFESEPSVSLAAEGEEPTPTIPETGKYAAPFIRIEFGGVEDLQLVEAELQEVLDRLLGDSDYPPMLKAVLGTEGGDLAEAA